MKLALRCGISTLDFWQMTLPETRLALEAVLWRDERQQKREIALAWRTAALTRSKRLPSLPSLLAGKAKRLQGKELKRRRQEFTEMTANLDTSKLMRRRK